MANVFDQFDTAVQSGNVFDQFDSPDAQPEMGWLEYANNVARAAANGLTFGFADELAGVAGAGGNMAARAAGMDVPEIGYYDIRDKEHAGIEKFRETNPVAAYGSEIIGGAALPMGAAANMARTGLTAGNVAKGAALVGAPMGAASAIGEAKELNSPMDVATTAGGGALAGGIGYGVAAPAAYGLGKGLEAIKKAVTYARDPHRAAVEKTAQALMDEDVDFNKLRGVVAPKGQEDAARRGLTNEQVSEVVTRYNDGEDYATIAQGMVNPKTGKPFTDKTLAKYVAEYRDSTEVPLNIIDAAKTLPESGGAQSVTNLARAAASTRGKAQSDAAKALINRQTEQGGRMGEHFDRAVGGADIEAEIARLDDVVGKQAAAAYGKARDSHVPFDLRPAISKWRADAKGNDEVSQALNRGLDTFFDPGMVEEISAKTGKPLDQLRYSKLMQPTSDMDQFMRSRRGLDNMIETAKGANGKHTPLSRALSSMRRDLNEAARAKNSAWLDADARFAEGKGGQAAIEAGEKLALRAGGKQRQIMAQFQKMTKEQKELFRLGFVRNLQDRVANKREGADVAKELNTDGMKRLINTMFPKKQAARLIQDIEREAVTTETLRGVFQGSRTAPLLDDMNALKQDASLAANLMTGNLAGTWRDLADRVMRGLNEKQSEEIIKLLTNTDPAQLLPMLDKLQGAKARLMAGESIASVLSARSGNVAAQQSGGR